VAVVVAIVAAAVGIVAVTNLLAARRELADRVDPATLATEQMLGALVDQESAVRAYVLAREDVFLEPYTPARAAWDGSLRTLDGLVGDLDVAAEMDAVRAAGERWRTDYAEPTLQAVAAGSTEPRDDAALAAGKARFDQFRGAVDTLQQRLAVERSRARRDLDRATQLLVVLLIVVAAVLVALIAGLFRLVRRRVEVPLDELRADATTVAAGNFDHPVRLGGVAELHEVGTAVEAMRSRIVDELAVSHATRAELDQRATDLARSNAELEQFAYVASHDLQEPLRKVTAFSQLLQQRYGGRLDDRADQYIDFAVDGAKRMQILINDLLAFSRVGRHGVSPEPVAADALVDAALADLADLLDETGAEVRRDPLPRVEVVPTLGTAVFQNLIANAVKFHRAGVAPHVRVSGRVIADGVELTVADDGIGIDAAYAERVFVIFQRLHTKEAYPGTGIGLALCRKIVEQHGGRIWVDTDAATGPGTVVRFTLPPAVDEDEER
jgi:signal transduction histidine kinase